MTEQNSITLSEKDITRFMSYVRKDPDTKAWLWIGGVSGSGYGAFWLNGRTVSAHRVSYHIAHGAIPKGMFVCHKFEGLGRHNINPEHLFAGTMADNMADASKKGRMSPGQINCSSKLTEKQAIEIFNDTRSYREIEKDYPVSNVIVSKIKRGELWGHATNAEKATTHSMRNKSGFRGVSWAEKNGKWLAGIGYKNEEGESTRKHLGLYAELTDAAKAYDKAALVFHKEKALLNFPAR